MKSFITVVALLTVSVTAHGNITSPPARLPGPGMVAACGQQAVDAVLQDGTIPLEDVTAPLPNCQLNLCRGAVFADNSGQVQTFHPGQVVQMRAQIPIPHEGPMNVSVVATTNNSVLASGEGLIVFDSYADESLPALPANNTAFSITIPAALGDGSSGSPCTVPGDCVLQWFWFGTAVKQTYESCVDFVMAPRNQTL